MLRRGNAVLTPPASITTAHDCRAFACGEPSLDAWLRQRALKNEHSGASRTYVVCEGQRVVGYYALAVGSVQHQTAPSPIKRNMPDPIPVMLLGRLAVDTQYTGRHIGTALLRDAVLRTLQAAHIAGIRALLVHAISDRARDFYLQRGFTSSPVDSMTLLLPLAMLQQPQV